MASGEFGRQGVGAEESGAHRHFALARELARGAELLALVFEAQAIPGLDLEGRDALGEQRVEPGQGALDQLCFAGGARRVHRRDDAAALACNRFVRDAGESHLELVGAVAAVDEMGVAVDEAGCDPAAVAAHDVCGVEVGGRSCYGACVDDGSVAAGDEAIVDFTETGAIGGERREARVAPDSVTAHDRPFLRAAPEN
jgi:hypothetical protein